MSRILITGARGFIAGPLALQLAAGGHEVIGVERTADPTPIPGMDQLLAGDLLDPAETARVMSAARPAVVVHLAARGVGMSGGSLDRPGAGDIAMNAVVLNAIERTDGVRHVIFASTAAVYAPLDRAPIPESAELGPTSDYGISKAASEVRVQALANEGRTATVLRFANVVGAGERRSSVVSSVCRQIAAAESGEGAEVIKHGRLDEGRDFVDVADAARAIAACCDIDAPGALTYNVGTGRAVPIAEVVSSLVGMARRPMQLELDPTLVRDGPATHVALDPSALRKRTGWQAQVPLPISLANTLEFWREQVRR
jgi:nucleoside-diphosphate-sugar epimerase